MRWISVISLFLFFSSAFAEVSDEVLRIQAKIYPRIFFFDQNHTSKIIQNKVVLGVFYCSPYQKSAEKYQQILMDEYQGRLKQYDLEVIIHPITEFQTPVSLAYIMAEDCSNGDMEKAISHFNQQGIITMASGEQALDKGSLIGLYIGRKTQPYVNEKVLKEGRIKFAPSFLRLSRMYDGE